MGIYQLRYLERVPPHAAVSESVDLVKRAKKSSAAGLVNAVLRKVDRQPIAWPDWSVELSTPQWLLEKWERQFGAETTESIAREFLKPAEKPTSPSPLGEIQGYRCSIHRPAARSSARSILSRPLRRSRQQDRAGPPVRRRCRRLRPTLAPSQTGPADLDCRRVVLDGTQPLPFRDRFDRILVDAPCSGTGTLSRNPEIKWRLQPSDLIGLHRTQVALLRNAIDHLKPGGRLVYATCSLEEEENRLVIETLRRRWQVVQRLPGRDSRRCMVFRRCANIGGVNLTPRPKAE